ncbi:MAG: cation diffusion facilitator family transporter [Lachnospiraceae bacterium]|nr:cation diffusion facilitator family transporter [Lachnospiraceae bacterium]
MKQICSVPEEMLNDRNSIIVRTGFIGIAANLVLVAFKAAVGFLSNSVAVILDAVNNLSDALSSLITIIGAKLASKKPDKKHPLGYGRIEYLSALIVASIVLYAGLTSMVESVKKIFKPEAVDYSVVSLVIIAVAIVVKIVLGIYVKNTGDRINSGSLTASGKDALFDAVLSFSVLLAAGVYMLWGVSLEAWVGAAISVFIIKAGLEMLIDTLDEILGKRVSGEVLNSIKQTICEEEGVSGAFDLILHSYGPETYIGSVHVEVPDTLTAEEIDSLERRIASNVYAKHSVMLAGIGIYSVNTKDDAVKKLRTEITHFVMGKEGVLQIHGFRADLEKKTINFDLIIDYGIEDRVSLFEDIRRELVARYSDYVLNVNLDIDL